MTFLFDRNFDEEIAHGIALIDDQGDPHAAQSMSRDAEQRALSDAFEKGKKVGLAAGRVEAETELSESRQLALDVLANRFAELTGSAAAHRSALERQMLDFVLETCERVFPELIDSVSSERAIAQIRRCITLAIGRPGLTVFLAEDTLKALRLDLEATFMSEKSQSKIEFKVDPALSAGDARMEWENGAMHYSFHRICTGILETLRNARRALPDIVEQGSD